MMELVAVVVGGFQKSGVITSPAAAKGHEKKGKVMSRWDLYNPEYFYYEDLEEGWKKEEFNVNQRSEKKKRGTITKVQALHRIPNKRKQKKKRKFVEPFFCASSLFSRYIFIWNQLWTSFWLALMVSDDRNGWLNLFFFIKLQVGVIIRNLRFFEKSRLRKEKRPTEEMLNSFFWLNRLIANQKKEKIRFTDHENVHLDMNFVF